MCLLFFNVFGLICKSQNPYEMNIIVVLLLYSLEIVYKLSTLYFNAI